MKNNLYSIGEVSKIKGLTIKTLRYYHDMGIVIPTYIDEQSGYRYYSAKQFLYIDIVKGCRSLGVSIKDIQAIFKKKDTNRLIKLLSIKKEEIKKSITELEEVIENIDEFNEIISESNEAIMNENIEVQSFNNRYIIKIPCSNLDEDNELLYYSLLENEVLENKINSTWLGGIIYCYENEEINKKYVFKLIENISESEEELENENIDILPKGKYIIINYTKENEKKQREKLRQYMNDNNLKNDEIIEIDLINDFFNLNSYSVQLQIKIK